MTRPSDPDGWYDPDGAVLRQVRAAGEYRRSDPQPTEGVRVLAEDGTWKLVAPVPEGMETTAEERATDKTDIKVWLKKASKAIFAATEAEAAEDISEGLNIALLRIAELEAERDRLLIAEEDAKLFIYLHALAIECGYMPDPGESAYDLLQRAIMTRCPGRAALSGEGVTR